MTSITRAQLRALCREHLIGRGGFVMILPYSDPGHYILTDADFADELSLWPLTEIEAARRYLTEGPVRAVKSPSQGHSSYFMKHQAEAWLRETEGDGPHCYVSNGSMLVACVLEGIKIGRRSGPNAQIGVTPRRERARYDRWGHRRVIRHAARGLAGMPPLPVHQD
jgi:hypothetical protein